MSAIYRLKYQDAKGIWRGVKVVTSENYEDRCEFVPLDQATPFTSEADAWWKAAQFQLRPDKTKIF